MKIGIFDSGAGGLTVAGEVLVSGLCSEIVYYGDTARVPYGNKNYTTIIGYALEAVDFFNGHKPDLLIVACNTVSVIALEAMKKKAPYPVIGVVEAGIHAVSRTAESMNDSICIIGTKNTIRSHAYQDGLRKQGFKNVSGISTSLFVSLVEESLYNGEIVQTVMDYYFKDANNPEIIVLGCTHFPLLQSAFQEKFPQTKLVHSGHAIVENLMIDHGLKRRSQSTDIQYFATDDLEALKLKAVEWFGMARILETRK